MADVGRPTDLTDELLDKIKECIINGNNLKETADIIGKSDEVFYQWHSKNYSGLADKIEGWKRDRKIMLANKNIEDILIMDKSDKESLKVIQDTSKFVLETLDRENYSKRSELTGKDGKDLPTPIINVSSNDSDK